MRRFTFLIWLVLLFVVMSIPIGAFPEVKTFGFDKLSHLFLYSVLTVFLFFAYGKRSWKFLFLIVLIAIIDELHQYYIPGRRMSFYDLGADLLGGGLTFWILKA